MYEAALTFSALIKYTQMTLMNVHANDVHYLAKLDV